MNSNKWGKFLLGVICLSSSFGLLVMLIPELGIVNGTPDGWLGYWGGVIGSVIGILGTLFVLNIQISSDKKQREEEDKQKIELLKKESVSKNKFYLGQLKIKEISEALVVSNESIGDFNKIIKQMDDGFVNRKTKPDDFDDYIERHSNLIYEKLEMIDTVLSIYVKDMKCPDLISALTEISSHQLPNKFKKMYYEIWLMESLGEEKESNDIYLEYTEIRIELLNFRDLLYSVKSFLFNQKNNAIVSLQEIDMIN